MADEQPLVVPKRTQERADEMYDAWVQLLLKKIKDGTATAAEQKNALDYFEKCGLRPVIREGSKASEAVTKLLEKADQKTLTLPDGVVLRRPA